MLVGLCREAGQQKHAQEIYHTPKWPSRPLFYVCLQSLSDPSCAPQGHENVFILVPLAAGLRDSDEMREKYYDIVMSRLEQHTEQAIRDCVAVKRSYAMRDFEQDYCSYKGNAYGLANILLQTAVFKPPVKSHHVDNVYFAGQLTVPGQGAPRHHFWPNCGKADCNACQEGQAAAQRPPDAGDILGVSGKVPGAPHVEHAFTHHYLDSVAVPGPPVVSGERWESGLWTMGWVKKRKGLERR